MFGFRKRDSNSAAAPKPPPAPEPQPKVPVETPAQTPVKRKGLFSRLRDGLAKTRTGLVEGLAGLILGAKRIDAALLEDIETQLLCADVGVEATDAIIQRLTAQVSRKELADPDALLQALKAELAALLQDAEAPLGDLPETAGPFVILMVGVNGVGKTTTIGKLAHRFRQQGKRVMLAAGDTFRAAAVEQLKVWGERNDIPVVAQATGADAASVAYDALESARARDIDALIIDTAGRLHTQDNLMDELTKIKRVIAKLDPDAPHEVMLTLDAGVGQNALAQVKQFHEAVGLTGLNLTKLDGTAKGGVIFALAQSLDVPIRFIGVGEGIEDLRPFQAEEFVDALFAQAS